MSIAVLMISIIVKRDAIEARYPGGLQEYTASPYVWHDDHLTASSYMNWLDLDVAMRFLAKQGIGLDENRRSPDVAIVDQARGIVTDCDWLAIGTDESGQRICWLKDTEPGEAVYPQGLLE